MIYVKIPSMPHTARGIKLYPGCMQTKDKNENECDVFVLDLMKLCQYHLNLHILYTL